MQKSPEKNLHCFGFLRRPCQNSVIFKGKSLAHGTEQKANIASKKYILRLKFGVVFMCNSVELNLSCIVFYKLEESNVPQG